MEIKVGDVYRCKGGEGLKVVKYDPSGEFCCQVRSYSTGEWTNYHIEGEGWKLEPFLEQQEAVKEES